MMDTEMKDFKGSIAKERIGQTRTRNPIRPPEMPRIVIRCSVQELRDDQWEEVEAVREIGPCCLHHTKHYTL